jgi:hypothetical protein
VLAPCLKNVVLAATAVAWAKADVLTVTTTIQAAVDAAHPGDTYTCPPASIKFT